MSIMYSGVTFRRKVYPADPGFIHTFSTSGWTNEGHALETVVLVELDRLKAEVGYVKTVSGYDVDFHVRFPDGNEELIQVCTDISSLETRERELRALREASQEYPRARQRLLLLDCEQALHTELSETSVQTVYEWLLQGGDAP